MNPILYRYKDTEAVIKVMDGYTPGDVNPRRNLHGRLSKIRIKQLPEIPMT